MSARQRYERELQAAQRSWDNRSEEGDTPRREGSPHPQRYAYTDLERECGGMDSDRKPFLAAVWSEEDPF